MGLFDFIKKKDEDIGDIGGDDLGLGDIPPSGMPNTPGVPNTPGMQQGVQGNTAPQIFGAPEAPPVNVPPPQMPPTPQFSAPQPISPTPINLTQPPMPQFQQQSNNSQLLASKIDVLSSKIDALSAAIDRINQRLEYIERYILRR
jgi:hypothetical protein